MKILSQDILDQVTGALIGLAIGDALGGPIENMSAAEIASLFPQGVTDYVSVKGVDLLPGEVTDDTEMAFFVSESIIEHRGLEMDDIARRLISWTETGKAKTGPSTTHGVSALQRGVPWAEAGGSAEPSSGSLPRCAPIGLLFDQSHIVAATSACCSPTHRHPLAVAATVAQNLIVCRLLDGATWQAALESLGVSAFDVSGASTIRAAIDAGIGPAGAVSVLAEAVSCVEAASDPRSAIVAAVAAGGDTDTRGACVGLLAGARWGAARLPLNWVFKCPAAKQAELFGRQLAGLRCDQV